VNVRSNEPRLTVGPTHGDTTIRLSNISKFYSGVPALRDVSAEFYEGEVHAILGENGAGKSTLINIISGALQPELGVIEFEGAPVSSMSPETAASLGISISFQHPAVLDDLSVMENFQVALAPSLFAGKSAQTVARNALDAVDLRVPLRTRADALTVAEKHLLEIAKALAIKPKVLILDEPTASLTDREAERLFAMIEQAKSRGVGIVYVTHRMSEIHHLANRVTVLRDGKRVATLDVAEADDERLLQLMTGRVISQVFPKIQYRPARSLLEVFGLTTTDYSVRDLSLAVRAGEVVGLAGLVGSGKSVVGRACFGLERIASGHVTFDGRDVTGRSAREMLDLGAFYLPPDRREEGLVMMRSVRENVSLPWLAARPFTRFGFLDRGSEQSKVRDVADRLNLQPRNIEHDLERLSGGNQQKVLLAKGLVSTVKLFILDEPTVGVDVGTRVAIYGFIRDLCEGGAGILLISSDLPEILHLTNRTYVMYRGDLRAELEGAQITQDRILANFFERTRG
jgi:ribose transport system ATP-binding protein